MAKIVLKDGKEIKILDGATENCIKVSCTTTEEVAIIAEKLTEDNLAKFSILTENGQVCAVFMDKHLDKYIVYLADGVAEFMLKDIDTISKRLATLEATQETQDIAITELAEMAAESEV